MRRRAIVLALAVVAAFVGIQAAPTSAQEAFTVTGEAECTSPGTYTLTWTIDTSIGFAGTVSSAVQSGAAEGDIADSFEPNPFTFDDDFVVGTSVVSGDTVGTVTLDVTITYQGKGEFDNSNSGSVTLDGSCEAPPETDPTTESTAAPTTSEAAQQVSTSPTFTG